ANITAESTGRVLAVRLHNMPHDPRTKDMLPVLIARDTMHQNQSMAALEAPAGATGASPIPNSPPQAEATQAFSSSFCSHMLNGEPPAGRWASGASIDGKGEFSVVNSEPMGEKPVLGPARPRGGAQAEQI